MYAYEQDPSGYGYDYDYGYVGAIPVGVAEPPPFRFGVYPQVAADRSAAAEQSGHRVKLRVGQILAIDLSNFFPYDAGLRLALGTQGQLSAFASWDGGEGAPSGTPAALYGDQSSRTPGLHYRQGDEAFGPQALHYFGHNASNTSWFFQAMRPGQDIVMVLLYPPAGQPGSMPLAIYRLTVVVA